MSAIFHNSAGHQDLACNPNRTTLHLRPALKTSGKGIDLVFIFLAKIPLGDRLDCLRNYRI